MTPAQTKLYWREWAACWRAIRSARPELNYRDANQERHDLHRRALGYPRSSSALDNREFDQILSTFRSWSRPTDLTVQRRQINQPRLRMLWKLEHELLPQLAQRLGSEEQAGAYAQHILLDRFGTDDHTTLTDAKLQALIVTLVSRLKTMPAQTEPETEPAEPF